MHGGLRYILRTYYQVSPPPSNQPIWRALGAVLPSPVAMPSSHPLPSVVLFFFPFLSCPICKWKSSSCFCFEAPPTRLAETFPPAPPSPLNGDHQPATARLTGPSRVRLFCFLYHHTRDRAGILTHTPCGPPMSGCETRARRPEDSRNKRADNVHSLRFSLILSAGPLCPSLSLSLSLKSESRSYKRANIRVMSRPYSMGVYLLLCVCVCMYKHFTATTILSSFQPLRQSGPALLRP